MTMITPGASRALASVVHGASGMGDEVSRAVASGRPTANWISLSVETGERGIPRTDAPALAVFDQQFRLGPSTATNGLVELQLPHEAMTLMSARHGARSVAGSVDGTKLVLEHPGEGTLSLRLAMASGTDRPVRFEVDRILLGDTDVRVVAGAKTVEPPLHYRTGKPQPDVTSRAVRFDEPGWDVSSDTPRSAPDYTHSLEETKQAHFDTPRGDAFNAVASYTGRVNGHAAEGPIAEARRAVKGAIMTAGIFMIHAFEH